MPEALRSAVCSGAWAMIRVRCELVLMIDPERLSLRIVDGCELGGVRPVEESPEDFVAAMQLVFKGGEFQYVKKSEDES